MKERDISLAAVIATVMQTEADDPRLAIVIDVVRSMDALHRSQEKARAGRLGGQQTASKQAAKAKQNGSKGQAEDTPLPLLSTENYSPNTAQQGGASPEREGLGGLFGPVSSVPSLLPVPPDPSQPIRSDRESDERADGVARVFDRYRVYHPRAFPRPRSDGKEWRAIKARMAEGYTVEDLVNAIEGYHNSPFHCGENDRGTTYLDLSLIMRDGTHVAKGIELAAGPGAVASEKERRGQRAAQNVLERARLLGMGGVK